MLGTELLKGQGLGNQLFCYVTTRCIALEHGYDFSILGSETAANNIHSNCGLYFMDLDFGVPSTKEDYKRVYWEKEDRLFLPNSSHDLEHGAYVTGTDQELIQIEDNVLIAGNMQAEDYYIKYKDQIKQWLKVKPEYECFDYSRDDICVLHLRCTDYMDSPELFLRKKYWMDGMKNMRKINPKMQFIIITNDTKEAEKLIPGVKAYSNDLATDYSIIKNAKYLLLANSSFTYFPAFTSDMNQYVIAPKYWARHNVSDGYWASEQNIYEGFHYMDRKGHLFTTEECRQELDVYKKTSRKYSRLNQKPDGLNAKLYRIRSKYIYEKYYLARIARGVLRRIKKLLPGS
ncbi:MAG: glycosyl transferase [Lachnospiraceae bacterium]|nr:glycosyl transferase [Lachnospiraceae bacterium]